MRTHATLGGDDATCTAGSPLQTVKPKLTEEQTANLKVCFKMMDADGSGAIDADELHAAFKVPLCPDRLC